MALADGSLAGDSQGSPPRVLVLQPDSEMYGACRATHRTLAAMGAHTRTHVIVCFPYDGPALAHYRALGCEVFVEPRLAVFRRSSLRPMALLRLARDAAISGWRLRSVMRRHRIELVHTNSAVVVTGALAATLGRRPHVWQIREFPTDRPLLRHVLALLVRCGCTLAAPVSRSAASLLRPRQPLLIVPDGYDAPPSQRLPRAGRLRIASVGRIIPTKGHDLVLDAVAALPPHLLDRCEVLVAGTIYRGHGRYAAALTDRAAQPPLRGRVSFVGFVEDTARLFEAVDIVCIATRTGEGFGLVALEAMAHGTAVVAATTGGLFDEIPPSVMGTKIAPGDTAALSGELASLLADPQALQQRSQAGCEFAAQFSVAASAAALGSAWQLAAAGRGRLV